MKQIPGISEKEILEIINRCVCRLAPKFIFPGYDIEDIKQEGTIIAFEALNTDKYDVTRPLENFLYSSIHNGLFNFKRDNFRRNDPPCIPCSNNDFCNTVSHCKKYLSWKKLNESKANVIGPKELTCINEDKHNYANVESDMEIKDILEKIDRFLSIELRPFYLQMKAGVSIPKIRKLEIEVEIKKILKEDLE